MRWARLFACLLVLAEGVACQTDDSSGAPVINRCAQSFECTKPDTCDPDLGICAHPGVDRPYAAVLQVVPKNVAGSPVLRRVTLPPVVLLPSTNYIMDVIRVQRVVTVTGSVLDDRGRAMEAEVAFAPSTRSYLLDGVSAFTLPDSAGVQRFSVALDPGTTYDVTVFPTANDSGLFPPANFALPATAGDLNINFAYPPQATLSAKLLDENKKPAGMDWKVRLRKKGSHEITSSLGRIQEGGVFQIRAPATMLTPSALAEQELLLEVGKRGDPELVAIAFLGERLREGGTLVMPTIPAAVSYSCTVEIGEPANGSVDSNVIRADLTFESSFPIPTASGDVREKDWCRLRLPGSPQGTFTCSTSLTASVGPGPDFRVSALLLPGEYQVFVSPNGDANDRLRVATSNLEEQILSQPDGMQSGTAFPLSRATRFEGVVISPQSRPMPAVTVTANALGIQRDLEPVARYNRTAEQRSDSRGAFKLAVDVGYYDLLAEPPLGSGYAWVLKDNRRIDSVGEVMVNRSIDPQIPVVSKGRLLTTDNKPVVNARVDMFALVDNLDPEQGGQRAVRIASTTSNSTGNFWLLLPPTIGEDDEVVPGLDGGVRVTMQQLDGGARDAQ